MAKCPECGSDNVLELENDDLQFADDFDGEDEPEVDPEDEGIAAWQCYSCGHTFYTSDENVSESE